MALTAAQETALAAAIRADTDPEVITALGIRNDVGLAELYNADSIFVTWRSRIDPDEYREQVDWTEVDNLTIGKARIWEWLTQGMTQSLNASKSNVRAGLNNCWNNTTTKDNLLAIATRYATKCEALFATGSGTTLNPGTLVYEGKLSHYDVSRALNNNPA